MKLIMANWKLYLGIKEAARLAEQVVRAVAKPRAQVVICPSAPALMTVGAILRPGPYALGAQDVGLESRGAFTGQVSAKDLKTLGCQFVIVGHSERRQLLGETDGMVRQKLETALAAGLKPVLCVGETKAERRAKRAGAVVRRQLRTALHNLKSTIYNRQSITIAYEPIWAIGTGIPATVGDAVAMHEVVRKEAKKWLPLNTKIQVIYGGSVTNENIQSLLDAPGVDGVLIGGASAKRSFIDILKKAR